MTESDSSTRPGRRARRVSRTRKRLLEAALAVFTEKGVDACSIEEITERADVGKGTFYRHFQDKYAILNTLVETALGEIVERMSARKEAPAALPEAVAQVLDAHVAFFTDHTDNFILLFQSRLLLKLHPAAAMQLEKPFAQYLASIEQRLAPHLPAPADAVKRRRLACAVAGCVAGFFSIALVGMKKEELAASIEPLRRAFLAGIPDLLK
jgi:AcrR family transcriptional regulator